MATLNTLKITDLGLFNINNKIIDTRTFNNNLINTVGNPSVVLGNASDLSEDSYFTYPLYLNGTNNLSVSFEGIFTQSEAEQCAWELESSLNSSVKVLLSNNAVTLYHNETEVSKIQDFQLYNNETIKVLVVLKPDSYEFTFIYGNSVEQRTGSLAVALNLDSFNNINIGSSSTNRENFWAGLINLNKFFIYTNNGLIYAPSDGTSWSFSSILLSDGEFPLENTSTVIPNHIYSFDIKEISKSGSTVLLTCQVDEDVYLTIKEIGLYIQTPTGKVLYGIIKNLNISKEKNLPYDLIFTINITINVVNALGFPANHEIVVEDPEYALFKDFVTVKEVNTYVLSNLERIIRMNAGAKGKYENSSVIENQAGIGHNRPQIVYRIEQEFEKEEDCYNSIDTFVKLSNRFQEIIEKEVNAELVEPVGDIEIPKDGNISDFSENKYIKASTPFADTKEWSLKTVFTSSENTEGKVASLTGSTASTPLEMGVEDNKCYLKIEGAESITPSLLDSTYIRNSSEDSVEDEETYYYWSKEGSGNNLYNFHLDNLPVSNSPEVSFPQESGIPWIYPKLDSSGFEITFRIKLDEAGGIQYVIGKPAPATYVPFELSVEQGKLKAYLYEGSTGDLISNELICRYPLETNKYYSIILSYKNGRYTLSYIMEPEGNEYPQEENVFIDSNKEVSFEVENGAVVIGLTGKILYNNWGSPKQELDSTKNWIGNCYYNNEFVALSEDGYVSTSQDGNEWKYVTEWAYPAQNANLMDDDWVALAYDGTKFVALRHDGYVSTSTNGSNWTIAQSSLGFYYWRALTYDGVKFVALGYNGHISTSTDGTTWITAQNANLGSHHWRALAYDGTKFVALGDSGYVSTSTDGTTWTVASYNSNLGSNSWYGISYDGVKFVALGYNGHISTSTDGTTWTVASYNSNLGRNYWVALTYDGTEFVALGASGYVSTSTDGTTWTVAQSSLGFHDWVALTYDGTKFIALRRDGYTSITYRANVNTWTIPQSSLGIYDWRAFAYNGTKFVALGQYGYVSTSTNGVTWTTASVINNLTGLMYYWRALACDSTKFIALGEEGAVSTSTDGTTWTVASYNSNLGSNYWRALAYDGTKFVALGASGYVSTSTDGTTWTVATYNSNLGNNDWYGISYDGVKFIALGHDGYVSTSTDGTTWTVAQNSLGSHYWRTLAYDGTKFVALGRDGYLSTSADGTTWTTAAQNANLRGPYWRALTYDGTKFVALGDSGYISTLINITWTSMYSDNNKMQAFGYQINNKLCYEVYSASATSPKSWSYPVLQSHYIYPLGPHDWRAVAYDGTKYVALGYTGYVSTSEDGITWTEAVQDPNLGDHSWVSFVWDGTKFVALSSTGYISTSEDGITWTEAAYNGSLANRNWIAISYNGTKFIALGMTSGIQTYISTSTNGVTWTTASIINNLTGLIYAWRALACDSTKFIALGVGGAISTSTDGTNWSDPTTNPSMSNRSWRALAYDGTKFTALGSAGYTSTSSDGTTWTTPKQSSALGNNSWVSLAWDGTKLLALNNIGFVYSSSLEGSWEPLITFQNLSTMSSYTLTSTNSEFVALSTDGQNVSASKDGVLWHSVLNNSGALSAQSWVALAWDGNKYVALGQDGHTGISTDKITWLSVHQDFNLGNHHWKTVAHDGTKFVALSSTGYISTSEDGISWTEATYNSNLGDNSWVSLTWDGSKFVAIGRTGFTSTSTRGTTWNEANQDTNLGNNSWAAVIYNGTNFVAISTTSYVSTSTDGVIWASATQNSNLYDGGSGHPWKGLACDYSTGQLLALGTDGYISRSVSGILWERASLASSNVSNRAWMSLVHDGANFVALSQYGYTSVTTTESIHTWEIYDTNLGSSNWQDVTFDGSNLVALGANGSIAISNNGYSWTTYSSYNLGVNSWKAISYGNNKFVALGDTGYVSTSEDGITWIGATQNTNLGSHSWRALAYDGTKFIALGRDRYLSTSVDGTTWTVSSQDPNLGSNSWSSLIWDGTQFVAIGSTGYLSTSEDGITWSSPLINTGYTATTLSYLNGTYVAVGPSGNVSLSMDLSNWFTPPSISEGILYPVISVSSNSSNIIGLGSEGYITTSSDDGETWTTSEFIMNLVASKKWSALTYHDGQFLMASEDGYTSTSQDGTSWTEAKFSSDLSYHFTCKSVLWVDDQFIALSSNGRIATSEDGTNWTQISSSSTSLGSHNWKQLNFSNSQLVAMGSTGYVALTNPNSELSGTLDFSQLTTSGTQSWAGAVALNEIYTLEKHPIDSDLIYDLDYYIVLGASPENYSAETIVNENNLFTVSPNNKYEVSLYYSEENGTGTYIATKTMNNNPDTTEEVMSISRAISSPVDRMGVPSITQIGPLLNGTINLLDWEVTQGESSWIFSQLNIIRNNNLKQFYRMPNYPRSQYGTKDICNLDKKINFLGNQFTGNGDFIDLSNPKGCTLCIKVNLTDFEPKVLLYKSDLKQNIYFSLTFLDQTLTFTMETSAGRVALSRLLDVAEYSSYTKEPIMITIAISRNGVSADLKMYKNNTLLAQEGSWMDEGLIVPDSVLSNYIQNMPTYETEDGNGQKIIKTIEPGKYVSDIVFIEGSISEKDLFYINNLFDTNY